MKIVMLTNFHRLGALALIGTLGVACGQPSADDHVATAESYLQESRMQEAIMAYRMALETDPMRGDIRQTLADLYVENRDGRNALQEYVRAADLLTENAAAQVKAGEFLLLARAFEDAKARAQRALALEPRNVDAQILLGNALAGLKDMNGAMAEYQTAIALDPTRDAGYASLGMLQAVMGDAAEAETSFRKAVDAAPRSIPAHIALANFLWADGRPEEAEAAFEAARALEPENYLANRALGTFYMSSGRVAEAEPFFKTVAAAEDTDEARLGLTDYYVVAGRTDEARRLLQELASTPDAFADATVRLAALDAADGQRAQALGKLTDVLEKHPQDQTARLVQARVLSVDGKPTEALEAATRVVTEDPTSTATAGAYLLIGQLQAARGRTNDAIAAFEEAQKRTSRPVVSSIALGALYLERGDLDRARTYIQQALAIQPGSAAARALNVRALIASRSNQAQDELDALRADYPDHPEVLNLVAANQIARRDTTGARSAYAKAASVAPGNLEALAGLVTLDLAAGRSVEAVSRVESALERGEPSGDLLLLAARAYASAGDQDKAEAALRRAITVAPESLPAYAFLGQLYVSQRRIADAVDQFRQVVALDPASVSGHTMLGMLYEAQQRPAEAEAAYEAALRHDPDAAVAANNLAWMYVASDRNLDQALQLAQAAQRAVPEDPNINDTLGWIYYRKQMTSQAVRHLEAATSQAPNDPLIHYHLGMAYASSGDTPKAREALKKAVASNATFDGVDEARQVLARMGG